MAEGTSDSKNSACVVSCVKGEDIQLLHTLIEGIGFLLVGLIINCFPSCILELTGQNVSSQDITKSPLSWSVDNKYYSARIELSVVTATESWDKKGEHQAVIFLCDLDKVYDYTCIHTCTLA